MRFIIQSANEGISSPTSTVLEDEDYLKSADIASKKAFIVLNPVAGLVNPVLTKRAIENHFAAKGWQTDFYLTEKDENLAVIVGQAIKDGPDIIVAAGGDGTVAAVAAGIDRKSVG